MASRFVAEAKVGNLRFMIYDLGTTGAVPGIVFECQEQCISSHRAVAVS